MGLVVIWAGGAWMIGYKAWGSLLGRRLSKQGVLVCCLDYRNFPQVSSVCHSEAVYPCLSHGTEELGQLRRPCHSRAQQKQARTALAHASSEADDVPCRLQFADGYSAS